MKLLIDIGNTAIKWTMTLDDKTFTPVESSASASFLKTLHQAWQQIPKPQSVLISNVLGELYGSALQAYCLKHWDISPYFAYSRPQCGQVTNGYEETHRLGVDRWLTAIGAFYKHQKACCVIDCGTAITLDVINDKGQFVGGYILPGFDVVMQGFKQRTAKIKLAAATCSYNPSTEIPRNTATAIEQGHLAAIKGACHELRQTVEKTVQQPVYILSGGNGAQWQALLPFDVLHEPTLIFEGLLIDHRLDKNRS